LVLDAGKIVFFNAAGDAVYDV